VAKIKQINWSKEMENMLNNILTFLKSSGNAGWLIPLFITVFVVIISKSKDILDFLTIQSDNVSYTLIEYLIKNSIPDKKNIIKIEYQLNDETKLLRQELKKILYKNDILIKETNEFKLPLSINEIRFEPSQTALEWARVRKLAIPIKTLCHQKDELLEKEFSEIKLDSEKLRNLYVKMINDQEEILSSQSKKIEILQSYIQMQKRSSLFLNAGLYNALARKLLGTVQFKEKETVSDTLIGAMLNKKAKIYTRSYLYLVLSIILYIGANLLIGIKIEPFVIYANIFFLALTLINQKTLEFRITNGYYGSNEYESREILRFIAENSDGTNFSGGTGLKSFPAESVSESIWVEGCITV
jgi:hypothetical protein